MFFKKKKIDVFYYSDVGGRNENEDSYGVFRKEKNAHFFSVADGLGGHGGGAVASKMAIDTMKSQFLTSAIREPKDLLKGFEEANSNILNLQTMECQMKTTLVTLYVEGNSAFWAHIGDSRLYHFVNGKIVEQTFDHSVSQMAVVRNEITQDEIRHHVDRNRLLRALGLKEGIKIDISERKNLKGKQNAFLLCTDGFWEYVYEKEMEETLRNAKNAKEWGESMLRHMKDRVEEGNDNNTVVAVIIGNK